MRIAATAEEPTEQKTAYADIKAPPKLQEQKEEKKPERTEEKKSEEKKEDKKTDIATAPKSPETSPPPSPLTFAQNLIDAPATKVHKDPIILTIKEQLKETKPTPPSKAEPAPKIEEKPQEKTAEKEPVIVAKTQPKEEPKPAPTPEKKPENEEPPAKLAANSKPLTLFTDNQEEAKKETQDNSSILIPIEENKTENKISTIKPAAGVEVKTVPATIGIPATIGNAPAQEEQKTTTLALEPLAPPAASEKPEAPKAVEVAADPEQKIETENKQENKKSIDYGKIQIWEGKEGDWLKKTVHHWSRQSGVTLVWNTSKRPELEMDMYVSGTLENALKTLFSVGVKDRPHFALDKEKNELVITD